MPSVERKPIQQLPVALVNRIAAGEVIERPASVVKELVENSLDAGANAIIVEIEDGGRELIRVIDDGGGIPARELPLAFAEHATSKISCDDDLFRIATMGFRGEALASIGAVSQARILSRTGDGDAAYEVWNRGGTLSAAQAAAGNVGTCVEIRNLFYNTPARRKFMKGSATEFAHISEAVLRLALPYPKVSFKLLHGGRVALDLPATSQAERWLTAWPDEFRGRQLPLEVRDAEIRMYGLVGLPELARPTPKHQYFYLNGRHIRDKFIAHAAREAYRGLVEPARQPAVILLLEMPAQDIDVNVHPTKIEVRFKDSNRIHGLVLSGIREKLLGSDLTPNATPQSDAGASAQDNLRQRLAAFFKEPAGAADAQAQGNAPPPPAGPLQLAAPHPVQGRLPLAFRTDAGTDSATGGQDPGDSRQRMMQFLASAAPVVPDSAGSTVREPLVTNPAGEAATRGFGSRGPAIQLHNTYLVAETEDGMIIIDQHALHERVIYEQLRGRLARGPLESQRLLIPPTLAASPQQMALLETIGPLLQKLGIELAQFGPDTLAIHAFPSFLDKLEPGRFVRELLERGEQELLDLHDEALLHGVLDMMACKAAVKAGDPLTSGEIEALLANRHLVERSSNCPHGRPTTLRLTLADLEKQFKRTGF